MRIHRSLSIACVVVTVTFTGCTQPNGVTIPGQVAVGDDGYTVTATFDGVENLVPNSQVLYNDVEVGTVASIGVNAEWQADVELRLLDDVELPANAPFAIGQKTLLGAQYVEIADPARPRGRLTEGDVVPATQTGIYPSTEQVLGAASLLLNNGGLSQISTITGQLTTALDGRVPQTRDLIDRLTTLLATLDTNKAQIISTLESLESLTQRLDDNSATVAEAVEQITPGLATLNRQRRRLVRAVEAAGVVSDTTTHLIVSGEQPLLRILAALRPTLTRLSRVSGLLPEALNYLVSLPFPISTTDNAIRGDYANLFATIDLSATALADSFNVVPDRTPQDAPTPGNGPPEAPVPTPQGALDDLPLLPDLTDLPGTGRASGAERAGTSQGTGDDRCAVVLVLLGVC